MATGLVREPLLLRCPVIRFVVRVGQDLVRERTLACRIGLNFCQIMQLMYLVTAAMLGRETARRIFHMESIIQDPNIQELVREWEDKGRAEEARALLLKVLALRSLPVTPDVRARIDGEPDVARLEAWLEAAVTASAIGDVFRDG
jgi:hypothetical protein